VLYVLAVCASVCLVGRLWTETLCFARVSSPPPIDAVPELPPADFARMWEFKEAGLPVIVRGVVRAVCVCVCMCCCVSLVFLVVLCLSNHHRIHGDPHATAKQHDRSRLLVAEQFGGAPWAATCKGAARCVPLGMQNTLLPAVHFTAPCVCAGNVEQNSTELIMIPFGHFLHGITDTEWLTAHAKRGGACTVVVLFVFPLPVPQPWSMVCVSGKLPYYAEKDDLFETEPELRLATRNLLRVFELDTVGAFHFQTLFWIGPAGALTGLHTDVDATNFLYQMHGSKRVWLYPIDQVRACWWGCWVVPQSLWPLCMVVLVTHKHTHTHTARTHSHRLCTQAPSMIWGRHSLRWTTSIQTMKSACAIARRQTAWGFLASALTDALCACVRVCHRFPRFQHAKPLVIDVHAGDVLYVPSHWYHAVESLTVSVSLSVRLYTLCESLSLAPLTWLDVLHHWGFYRHEDCVCHNPSIAPY